MSSRYRYEGAFGVARPTRTFRKWLIAYEDGEEVYAKKDYVSRLGKLALRMGQNIHVYEETVTHTINHSTREVMVDKFRIDMTERLRMEIKAEQLDKKIQEQDI